MTDTPERQLIEDFADKVRVVEDRVATIKINPDISGAALIAHQKCIENQKRFLVNLLTFRGNIGRAARATGISRNTHLTWQNDHPIYKEIFDELEEDLLDLAEEKLSEAISMGHWPAIAFMLKTKGSARGFVDTTKHEHNFDDFDEKLIAARERARKLKAQEKING